MPPRHQLHQAHRPRSHIRRNNLLLIRRNPDHVRPVLPCAQHPIDLPARRIKPPNHLRALSREPRLPSNEGQPMRPMQRLDINRRHSLLPHQIHHRQRMQRSTAIVRNPRRSPILRSNHLMRIIPDRHLRQHLQTRRINNRQRMPTLRQNQQRTLRATLMPGQATPNKSRNHHRHNPSRLHA